MEINLGNKKYNYLIGYQKDDKYRLAFNELAKKTFPISFEEWYQSGYWKDKYIPYTLFDGVRAIANASINIMDFHSFGKRQRYLQVGTVMTDVDYRNQGLSKFLMFEIMKEWENKCDFIYLFANTSALDFYPKLGFESFNEFEYFKTLKNKTGSNTIEKINMDVQSNRDKLYEYTKNSNVFSKLSMQENADLVLFYCITFLKDNVFFIKSLDAFVIASVENNSLCLWDIFSKNEIDLEEVIGSFDAKYNEVILGFTPKDISSFHVREIKEKDVLFIQKNKTKMFDENKIMFPLLSHA